MPDRDDYLRGVMIETEHIAEQLQRIADVAEDFLPRIVDVAEDFLRVTLSAQRMMMLAHEQTDMPWQVHDAVDEIQRVMASIQERRGW